MTVAASRKSVIRRQQQKKKPWWIFRLQYIFLAIVILFAIIHILAWFVLSRHDVSNNNNELPSFQRVISSLIETPKVDIFEWKCVDDCSCLPPVNDDHIVSMHQSYKTTDVNQWPTGWKNFRQTWLNLHSHWRFIFWLDEHNMLLAKCMGHENVFANRSFIQQADLARLMYLERYGGLYADMDYLALQNQEILLDKFKEQNILLQGRKLQVVGLEWGYARRRNHPLWSYCLTHNVKEDRQGCAIYVTGPKMLGRCLRSYYKTKSLLHMHSYDGELMILEPRLLAPIEGLDLASDCGQWRTWYNEPNMWDHHWSNSTCREGLIRDGSFAVTVYSHTWGEGLKC